MKLTYSAFTEKWSDVRGRFADNDTFEVAELDLRDFALDIADTFGVDSANVPVYVAGNSFVVGYLVRYTLAGGQESFFYARKVGKLPAPTAAVDENWKVVPGPVVATQLYQAISLAAAQNIDGALVIPGRLYRIDFGPDAHNLPQLIYVQGLGNNFDVTGTLEVNGVKSAVRVNVAAGTFEAIVASDPNALSTVKTDPQTVAGAVTFSKISTFTLGVVGADFALQGTDAPANLNSLYKLAKAFEALVAGAPEAYDALLEIVNQLKSDEQGAAGMLASINQLKLQLLLTTAADPAAPMSKLAVTPIGLVAYGNIIVGTPTDKTLVIPTSSRFNTFYSGTTGAASGSITIAANCNNNTYEWNSSGVLGTGCNSNRFCYGCRYVTLGNACGNNTVGAVAQSIVFGNGCNNNTVGAGAKLYTFGDNCVGVRVYGTDPQGATTFVPAGSVNTVYVNGVLQASGGTSTGTSYDDSGVKASIELLRARIFGRNRGSWAANTDYLQYDFVTSGGTQWYASVAFTSGATFEGGPSWVAGTYQASGPLQYIGPQSNSNLYGGIFPGSLGDGSRNNFLLSGDIQFGANCSYNTTGLGCGSIELDANSSYNRFLGRNLAINLGTSAVGNELGMGSSVVTATTGLYYCRVVGGSRNVVFADNCQNCVADQASQYVSYGAGCQRVTLLRTIGTQANPFQVPAGTTDAVYIAGVLQPSGGTSSGSSPDVPAALRAQVVALDYATNWAAAAPSGSAKDMRFGDRNPDTHGVYCCLAEPDGTLYWYRTYSF
ncbi:MAG: hypothetical protein ACRYFK_07555 [Janthinobacterium lividum]